MYVIVAMPLRSEMHTWYEAQSESTCGSWTVMLWFKQ